IRPKAAPLSCPHVRALRGNGPAHRDRAATLTAIHHQRFSTPVRIADLGSRRRRWGDGTTTCSVAVLPRRELMARRASIRGFTLWVTAAVEEADSHAGLFAGLENGSLRPVVGKDRSPRPRAHTRRFLSPDRRARSCSLLIDERHSSAKHFIVQDVADHAFAYDLSPPTFTSGEAIGHARGAL